MTATLLVIDSAAKMRERAARWDRSTAHVSGYIADHFRDCAAACRQIADALDGGTVLPGRYACRGSRVAFLEQLVAGRLAPMPEGVTP